MEPASNRAFLILRYTLIVATAYLVLVEEGLRVPPVGVSLLIVAALTSNVIFATLPARITSRPAFSASVMVADTAWISAALLYSGRFGAEFFYLYFFVLLLAAVGENLRVIAITAVVVCTAYLYVLSATGAGWSMWSSPSLIRIPFLFTTAAFYGYLIDRARQLQRDARQQTYRELEQKFAQRTGELTATNRELSAFAYSVSHDLRAPLRAIEAFSQALLEDCGDALDDQGHDYLRRIRAGAQRMGQLINDLLTLSRLTRTEMHCERVDLSGVVESIAAELQRSQPNRSVRFDIASGVWATGDARLLQVVMDNLIGNAWKYTSKREVARIHFSAKTENGESVYFVSDDGAGFDSTRADKLFHPFQRLHTVEEFEGAGIGLATAQRIIHRHGGRVWAEATVDKGATFYFTLGTPAEVPEDGEPIASAA